MALHPHRRPGGVPVASTKEERAELAALVERIETNRDALRLAAATAPAAKNLLRVYGYYRQNPDDASQRARLLAAGRALAAAEAAASE